MIGLEKVKTKSINFSDYQELTPEIFNQSQQLIKELKGLKVIHLNSTQLGGGVSELLKSQVPLERSLGLNSSWHIIKAPRQFFKVTKKIHNLLQGEKGCLTNTEKYFYLSWLYSLIAPFFKNLINKEKPDILIIHDPQPLPLIDYVNDQTSSILRMHIDLSEPNPSILEFLHPLIQKYRSVVFSHPDYRPSWQDLEKSLIIMPAIDPFTVKNSSLSLKEAQRILETYNLNTSEPILTQVSRFDPWKDPLGTIEAYYLAKNKFPKLQLILAGLFQAYDDPEAIEVFEKVKKKTKGDADIFLFSDPNSLKDISNDLFINALYTASDIVIQKSIKEGFGLTVTEAMWKAKPVIGGQTPGISLQIEHGQNGLLVNNIQEAGQAIIRLLENDSLRVKMGQAAQKSVQEKFLLSRFVLDHLKLYQRFK